MTNITEDLKLFNRIANSLLEDEQQTPVSKRIPISELHKKLNITLSDDPISEKEIESTLKELVLATPKTASKLFFNQLFGGRQSKAVLGDLLAVLLNNSMYTYKVAGPQVGVEKEVIAQICKMINYGPQSGGTFPTGGSMSNYMAMVMARDHFDLNIRNTGTPNNMIAYTSKESHYSIPKNASFSGVGRNNVRYIPTNANGEMLPEKLEEQILIDIEKGYAPFFLNATAGTTVLGAFDPIEAVAKICKKYKIWLHVDGAYCGGVIFSEKYKHLIKGVEHSDSFSVNAHKMLGTPLTCSIIVVKDKKNLYNSFSNDADYLYQTDGDDYNLGKSSFQCGRRNDALKFWTLWKAVGTKGLTKIVNQLFYLADVARDYIRNHPDYTLYSFDNSISICFNYKGINASDLCTSLYEHNELMVGFGSFDGEEFVRLVTISANNSKEDILNFFKVLEKHVAKVGIEEGKLLEYK